MEWMNKDMWYCPMCGNKMKIVKREMPTLEQRVQGEGDSSIWWYCPTKECFGTDYPLREHNLFNGINSEPGDNWSLSWIK